MQDWVVGSGVDTATDAGPQLPFVPKGAVLPALGRRVVGLIARELRARGVSSLLAQDHHCLTSPCRCSWRARTSFQDNSAAPRDSRESRPSPAVRRSHGSPDGWRPHRRRPDALAVGRHPIPRSLRPWPASARHSVRPRIRLTEERMQSRPSTTCGLRPRSIRRRWLRWPRSTRRTWSTTPSQRRPAASRAASGQHQARPHATPRRRSEGRHTRDYFTFTVIVFVTGR